MKSMTVGCSNFIKVVIKFVKVMIKFVQLCWVEASKGTHS